MSSTLVSRRTFVMGSLAAGLGVGTLACADRPVAGGAKLVIGLIADLHHGNLTPDADERMDTFLQAVADRNDVDLLIQLGDFCHPTKQARGLCKRFNGFMGDKLHVLGNHDMDLGTKEQIMDLWGMPKRYGSTDIGGYHFITLDRNNLKTDAGFKPYSKANFYVDRAIRGWSDEEQLDWLKADLAKTGLPTIVLTHQPIGFAEGGAEKESPQVAPIMRILEEANKAAGWTKVQACFCGHLHTDVGHTHQGIHYLHFNSASYQWVKEPVRYTDALYAFVTLDPAGTMTVEGRATTWAEPTPQQRGLEGDFPQPAISDRQMKMAVASK